MRRVVLVLTVALSRNVDRVALAAGPFLSFELRLSLLDLLAAEAPPLSLPLSRKRPLELTRCAECDSCNKATC